MDSDFESTTVTCPGGNSRLARTAAEYVALWLPVMVMQTT
jgi:hypothetical protein